MAELDLTPFGSTEFRDTVEGPGGETSNLYKTDPRAEGGSWGDYPNTFVSRAAGIGSDFSSVLRAMGETDENPDSKAAKANEALGRFGQELFTVISEGADNAISADGRARLEANVTNPDFWSVGTIALKATNMAPDVIAAAIPAAVTKNVLSSAAMGGALSAANMVNDLYQQTDAMSDDELMQVPMYKELRDSGLDEKRARGRYNAVLRGYRPVIAGVFGAITNAWTPGGKLAGRLAAGGTEVAEGFVKRTAKGTGEGFVSEGAQEGVEEGLRQDALVSGGLQDKVIVSDIVKNSLTGAVLGGVLGGAVSAPPVRSAAAIPTDNSDLDLTLTPPTEVDANPPVNTPEADNKAVPGVKSDTVVRSSDATVAQNMQAIKNYNKKYIDLTPEQQAEVDGKLTARNQPVNTKARNSAKKKVATTPVETVPEIGGDAAQTAAIVASKTETPVTPPMTIEPPVTPVVTPPVEPPVAEPVVEPAPVVAPEVVPEPVQEIPVETPVQPEVVRTPTPVQETLPTSNTAGSEPVQSRTGPRVLDDLTKVKEAEAIQNEVDNKLGRNLDYAEQAEIDAERELDRILEGNIDVLNKPGKIGKDARVALIRNKAKAKEIFDTITPDEAENGIFEAGPKRIVAARAKTMDRVKRILAKAETDGVKIYQSLQDNADTEMAPTAADVLLVEAKELVRDAKKAKDGQVPKERLQTFLRRELMLRLGEVRAVLEERREAGDVKKSVKGADGNNDWRADKSWAKHVEADSYDAADTTADEVSGTENIGGSYEAPDEESDSIIRERTARQIAKDKVPASIEKAVDDAIEAYTTPKSDRRTPVVQVAKKRVVKKPADDRGAKMKEVLDASFAKKKAAEDAVKQKLKELEEAAKARKAAKEQAAAPNSVTTEGNAPRPNLAERIKVAREKTNATPTDGQKEAGNYAKGRVSVQGMPIAIENPKGSTRTGPGWSVKMKHDYGYLEGTKGVDGDAVDVYVGPNPDSPNVFVIDQLNYPEGSFDEHKVMMGFKDEQAAVRAYDAAFSDGMGIMRIGSLHRMTVPELKAWLNRSAEARKKWSEETANEARSLLVDAHLENEIKQETAKTGVTREGYIIDPVTKRVGQYVKKTTGQEVLNAMSIRHLSGAQRVIAGSLRAKLTQLVGDIPVYFVDPDDMKRMTGRAQDQLAPYGYHINLGGGKDFIVINNTLNLLHNTEKLAHTVFHEMTHAATIRGMEENPAVRQIAIQIAKMANGAIMQMSDKDIALSAYAFTNVKEFIAEAMSNPRFQEILARIPVDEKLAKQLNLGDGIRTMWDALISAVRRALGLPKNSHTMLEAAIRATELSMRSREAEAALTDGEHNLLRSFLDGDQKGMEKASKGLLGSILDRPELAPTQGNPQLLGLRTFDSIARSADRYFKGNRVVRDIADIIEGQRVAAIKEIDRAAPIIQKLHDLQTKYSKVNGDKGTVWENFTALVHDETMSGVFADRPLADQKHISKQGSRDSWARKQHPDLSARYAKLPDDLKAARKEAMEFFTEKQNEMALKLIRNRIVTLFDTPDPEGLAQRIHTNTVTDADKELMGETYDTIAAAGSLGKIDGPYIPLMRRGNYIVKGRMKVTTPGNATAISENEFEFTDKDAATKFMDAQAGRPTLRTIYVDKNSGSRTGTENGKTVRLTANDMNAEPRYRVVVQNRHMEMFDRMKDARARVAELRALGMEVDDAVPRAFENYGIQADALSTQMRRMNAVLEQRAEGRGYTAEQKADLMNTLNEVSIAMLGSTRIQSRSLPRRYVAGASKDFTRNTVDYAHAAGNYIAKLDWRPKLDKALSDMADAVKENGSDGFAAGRTAIQNEVLRRVSSVNPVTENKLWNAVTSRVLATSFIDKLMSPSYSIINAAQPMMISAPYLSAHYGAMRAYKALGKAYSDINAGKALGEGFKATAQKAVKGDQLPTDPVSLIRERLKNAGEKEMIDVLIERGTIDTDSGLEVASLVRSTKGILGKLDGGIGYLEGIARQMPKTIEAINRTTVALAAYRLEMERSGDKARAVQFAQDTLNLTQFNYSASNTAPIMNHPALRLALQFKKYGLGMYQFLGEQAAIAIAKDSSPEARKAAIKALSYTIGMHVLVAGAMGLPTEPIKMVVTAANGLGITDWSWSDVEAAQREAMTDLLGKQFGEIVSRGVPRALGVDLSSRMGIDTLMGPLGEPRSNEAQDWKAYMWDSLSGAPAGLVADWGKGVNDLVQGDIVRGMERLVPIKAFSDSVKAYRSFTEGNVSETTGKQYMSPYGVTEAAVRALGFQPAREAESFERRSTYFRNKAQYEADVQELKRSWVEATPAARGRVWKDVIKWNRSQPAEARITLSDLRKYQRDMKEGLKNTKEGIRVTKREQRMIEQLGATYNFE